MKTLHDLERDFGPELRQALSTVMPTLEDPPATARGEVQDDVVAQVSFGTPTDLTPTHTARRSRWWLASAAVAIGLLVGGLAVIGIRSETTPNSNASAPTLPAPREAASNETTPITDAATDAPQDTNEGTFPLDGLDPYDAAAAVFLHARIGPTPDEQADLATAGQLLVRDCLRDGGAAVPEVTNAEHRAFRDLLDADYTSRTNWLTTTGIEYRRQNGFVRNAQPFDSDAGVPLHLDIEEGSPEAQMLLDGCNNAYDEFRNWPTEVALRASTFENPSNRWYSLRLGELPEFADDYELFDDCLSAAGYPDYDKPGADNPFNGFIASKSEYTAEERAAVNAFSDCQISTDLPTRYVNTMAPILDEYDNTYRDEIAAIELERSTSLETARATLRNNGIEPLTA